MARARALLLVGAVALAAGCGGSTKASTQSSTTAPTQQQQRDPTLPPANVPQRSTGPADPDSVRVIKAWSKALRGGDVRKAARYFSLPSKFQNATPVLTINIPKERIAINEALPCGAIPVKLGGAGDFTIVTFKLVKRVGGACGQGVGGKARTAIKVSGNQIHEWYRLPDNPNGLQGDPNSGPVV